MPEIMESLYQRVQEEIRHYLPPGATFAGQNDDEQSLLFERAIDSDGSYSIILPSEFDETSTVTIEYDVVLDWGMDPHATRYFIKSGKQTYAGLENDVERLSSKGYEPAKSQMLLHGDRVMLRTTYEVSTPSDEIFRKTLTDFLV